MRHYLRYLNKNSAGFVQSNTSDITPTRLHGVGAAAAIDVTNNFIKSLISTASITRVRTRACDSISSTRTTNKQVVCLPLSPPY